jgi:S1-C subfamily serine protease
MADGTVGAPVFRRTRMILDYARSRVIFEPGPGFADAYDGDLSGMILAAAPGGAVTVDYVIASSPAEQAGIAPGDDVLAVDGRPARADELDQIREAFARVGVQHRLTLRRGDAICTVTLITRRMI